MFRLTLKAMFLLITLFNIVNAQYAVRVYSKHENIQEHNVSRPRIYVENTGTESIRDFYYYYYFSVENNKVPTVERYYAPNSFVSLEDLGNGDYRVKYDYRNANLSPGDILPDPQGNVIGLRYLDWSPWDKSNDYSFDNSSEFQQNGKIPVFLADGTQISGSSLPDPETPPQPPEIKHSNSQYAVFSTEYTDLRDRSTVKGGIAGSAVYTEVGCDAVVNGGLLSGGDIFLRERAKINGDAAAQQEIKKQNNTVITGTERNFAEINFPQIVSHQVNPGTWDVVIGPNGTGTVNPGSYREIVVYANSSVTFKTGVYEVDRFIIEPDVKLIFESQKGRKTDIRVKSECRLGDRTQMRFTNDTIPLSISIYSGQTSQFRIGTDAVIYGQITAPDASVVVNSRTTVYGMIMGKQVIIEPQSVVCKPAVLLDFWHSEWAYAQSFDPLSFEYKAVVPDDAGTLQFAPYIPHDAQVFVNGTSYANGSKALITLNSSSTDITVEVKDPQNCGKTMYVINVQKSPDYRIFVNEKSPALPGQENGNSWQSAYKCLQKAIDKAEKEGKEIWVAEGTYYPVYKTNQNDPRSAAFLIKPGIEIIGGFNGDETGRKPKGSPYLTILSGDLSKNDQNIKSWPPSANDLQHMNDNVYRVMMTDGNPGSGGIRIEGLTIRGGVANGTGSNNSGAGIHNTERIPTIVNCAIIRNFSLSDGAGIYTNAASITIENSVIRDNVSLQGNGAGLFLNDAGYALINHTAFANNIAGTDSAHASRGGALYLNSSNVTLSTCVFVKNSAAGNGGSIYNNSGMLSVLYSTNVNNASIKGTGGIVNRDSSSSAIIHNSILWNNLKNGYGELSGSKFTVNYSCVTNGYQGTGNISDDPRFVDVDLPAGDDGKFATYDDGLKLKQDSPCRYSADTVGFETDFVGFDRPVGDRYDMGAYESLPIQPTTDVLGRFVYGVFTVAEDIPVFTNLSIEAAGNPHTLQRRIHIVANGAHARVVRAKVQKHKKTRVSSFEAEVTALDANMNRIPGAVTTKVRLYRAGEEGGNYLFWSLTPDRTKGKPIIFSNNYSIVGDNPDATILYNIPDGNIRVFVSKKQF